MHRDDPWEARSSRHPCACPSKPSACKCGAEVAIEGELCRYCRSGHAQGYKGGKPHIRFQAHVNHSLTAEAAKRHGLKRTEDGGTIIETEAQLNRYLAVEKDHGRVATWKEH